MNRNSLLFLSMFQLYFFGRYIAAQRAAHGSPRGRRGKDDVKRKQACKTRMCTTSKSVPKGRYILYMHHGYVLVSFWPFLGYLRVSFGIFLAVFRVSFGIFWYLSVSFGIFRYLSVSFGIFRYILVSFGIFFWFFDILGYLLNFGVLLIFPEHVLIFFWIFS